MTALACIIVYVLGLACALRGEIQERWRLERMAENLREERHG